MSSLSNRGIQEKTQLFGERADTEGLAGGQDPDLVQGKRLCSSQMWISVRCQQL